MQTYSPYKRVIFASHVMVGAYRQQLGRYAYRTHTIKAAIY